MSEKTKELAVQGAKMELNIDTSEVTIKNLIYVIRGQQVLLDSDLAMLYQVETKNLNKAVKRNANRFPEDFCFQLFEEEYDSLRFQFGTSKEIEPGKGGRRYLPYAFTEQGISMLSAVLRSEYPALSVDYTGEFHDRFLIIDGTLAYHVGASLKDAGKKCFAINRIEDRANIFDILSRIKKTYSGGTDDGRE